MLPATPEETQAIVDYMNWQAPDLKVEFLQKVYTENVLNHQHHVWDVHTNVDRWWMITNPTNLYSQEQFPNMDLAVTFHVGLCLRVPRSEKRKLSELPIEPFAECYRCMTEAAEALNQAQEVSDFQAIGVRCREALLAFSNAAQVAMPWPSGETKPDKAANFKAWVDHICAVSMAGESNKERRHLFKSLFNGAWQFCSWLIHATTSTWFDAEAATSTVEHAIGLGTSAVVRHIRGVPETCPACGSHRLSPQRGVNSEYSDIKWERPTCEKCGWTGDPVPIFATADSYESEEENRPPPDGECVIPTVPLRTLKKPGDRQE